MTSFPGGGKPVRITTIVRVGAVIAISAIGAWLGGLFWFAAKVPHSNPSGPKRTEAIVVLTGGSGRLGGRVAGGELAGGDLAGVARGSGPVNRMTCPG